MDNNKGNDFTSLFKLPGRNSIKPLSLNNMSKFDRKAAKSPQRVRNSLFEEINKENDESVTCKDYSDKEMCGKFPVTFPTRAKIGSNSSDESKETTRKMKPRRSMLGYRSKTRPSMTAIDDNTFTLTKPLLSSSSNLDRLTGRAEPRMQKATSTPTLNHPFETCDADSSFFSKGHSDSTWSVFKNNDGRSEKTKNAKDYINETPLNHGSVRLQEKELTSFHTWKDLDESTYLVENNKCSSLTIDQKLDLLALKFHNEDISGSACNSDDSKKSGVEKAKSKERFQCDEPLSMKQQLGSSLSTSGARTRAQAKKIQERSTYGALSPIPNDNEMDYNFQEQFNIESNTSRNSNDSFLQNEATIVGVYKEKLDDINNETLENLSVSCKVESADEDETNYSDKHLSTPKETSNILGISNLLDAINGLKKEKELMDLKLKELLEQKERYEIKWSSLESALDIVLSTSHKRVEVNNEDTIKKPSKIIDKSVSFSGLKANFKCIKTPVRSRDFKRLRKSVCYTPNSLSVLVGGQVKEIFGEE